MAKCAWSLIATRAWGELLACIEDLPRSLSKSVAAILRFACVNEASLGAHEANIVLVIQRTWYFLKRNSRQCCGIRINALLDQRHRHSLGSLVVPAWSRVLVDLEDYKGVNHI